MVVNDVVLVLLDNLHCGEHVQRVIYPSLHIFKVDLLANLAELLVDFQNFICDLSAGNHGLVSDLLKDGFR